MTKFLCRVLGGHSWSSPQAIDGKLRLRCLYDCGAVTAGVETRGQEQQRERSKVTYLNLRLTRGARKTKAA